MKNQKNKETKVNIKNRKATFEYEILDNYTAGIVLKSSDIKSIRKSKVSIAEAYCYIYNGELFIKNMHITEYSLNSINDTQKAQLRKLLLTKRELHKLTRSKEIGMTIIPLNLFVTQAGLAKIKIALAKGKKLHDKRQAIKDQELSRKLSKIATRVSK